MNELLSDFYVNNHKNLVTFLLRKAAVSYEDAEELAQNTYMSILRWPNYTGENTFTAYVYMVARKIVAKYVKVGNNYWSYFKTYIETETQPIVQATQDVIIQQKEVISQVYNFLLGLPPRQLAVARAVMDDTAYSTIKSELGITETNITSTWQVVLDKGKKYFKNRP